MSSELTLSDGKSRDIRFIPSSITFFYYVMAKSILTISISSSGDPRGIAIPHEEYEESLLLFLEE